METLRGRTRSKIGVVTSDKMAKTVIVTVKRSVQHPKYKKYVVRRTKFVAHDEEGRCKLGDKVEIVETRPMSRTKRWRVKNVLESARFVEEQALLTKSRKRAAEEAAESEKAGKEKGS